MPLNDTTDPDKTTAVSPASFPELVAGSAATAGTGNNLDLILDVEVPVTVVLGSVRKSLAEVLSLSEGQVIDLDRVAGEPVDLLVNGKLIARGEVVVVDEHYGLRVSQIAAPSERLRR
ncbi:MAG: flagellar motor switch protein FliN [Planctomycetes bacterium]|nr:flagellar motor switch protein FliN [Planctomycetota bacterium]